LTLWYFILLIKICLNSKNVAAAAAKPKKPFQTFDRNMSEQLQKQETEIKT
jgi:hypothetical protein